MTEPRAPDLPGPGAPRSEAALPGAPRSEAALSQAPASRAPGSSRARAATLVAFSLALLLLAPVYGDNENRSHALLDAFYRGSVTIDVQRFPTCDLSLDQGQPRSGGAPGVALVGFLAYAPVRFLAARLSASDGDLPGYFAAIAFAAILPATLGAFCLIRLRATRASLASPTPPEPTSEDDAALVFALGTLALAYASRFMAHALEGGALSVALLAVARALCGPGSVSPETRSDPGALASLRPSRAAALAGLAAGIATMADYPAALALLAMGLLLVLMPGARVSRGLAYALGATAPLAVLLIYHAVAFGHPLHTPYQSHSDPDTRRLLAQGFMGYELPTARTLLELTLGARAGLLPHVPALVPGAVGLALALRSEDRRVRAQGALGVALTLAYFFLNAGRRQDWWAGASVGPRYLLVALPMALAFLPEGLAWFSPRARHVLVVLAVAISWLEVQASLHFWPESLGFVGRLEDVVKTGPQLGWVRFFAFSTGTPSRALVPLISAILIVAWSALTARLSWRHHRPLALAALGIAILTLGHLELAHVVS